jgi:hypothetical protein
VLLLDFADGLVYGQVGQDVKMSVSLKPSTFLRGELTPESLPEDSRRCRVCGHITITPVRRTFNGALLVLVGMLLAYIVLDVAHGGRFDGSILKLIYEDWQHRSAQQPRQP